MSGAVRDERDEKVLHFPPGKCVLDEKLEIFRILFEPMSEVSLTTAKAQVVAMRELSAGRKMAALVDMRRVKSCDRDARDYYAGPELAELVSVCAMLIGSNRVAAVIGNFTIAVHGGRLMPTKLFVDEEKAIAWILSFRTRDQG